MFSTHDLAFALIFKISGAQNLWVSDQMFDKLLECSVFVIHFREAKWEIRTLFIEITLLDYHITQMNQITGYYYYIYFLVFSCFRSVKK